jgi:glycosyltransferase involved in cell wall biosynthesis
VRRQLAIAPEAPVCGIVAALRPEKNHELFLHAAAKIAQVRPEARFLIIGDGPRRGDLEQLARDLKICEAVQFLGSRRDVAELLTALDVFALTSHNEANPVSILEAMAVALPVAAVHVGSVAESVEHAATGYLVKPGSIEETAARCLELFADASLRRSLGAAGRARVVQRWSLEAMVAGYEDLIAEIYNRKTAPPGRSLNSFPPEHAFTPVRPADNTAPRTS